MYNQGWKTTGFNDTCDPKSLKTKTNDLAIWYPKNVYPKLLPNFNIFKKGSILK